MNVPELPLHLVALREGEQCALNLNDFEEILEGLRNLIENQARSSLAALDEALARKVQGARDALHNSADGASQAANSLIELINRLLRRAFTEPEALTWVRENLPNNKELRFVDSDTGRERPTKQGHALCFLYAGKPIDDQSRQPIHAAMAKGIADTRRRLEQIKHADKGTPEEINELRELMAGVEGFITYAVRVGWNSLDEPSLGRLRRQLDRPDDERVVA